MNILHITLEMTIQSILVYLLIYTINIRYYKQISKAQKSKLFLATLASSLIFSILHSIIGVFAHLFTFIPIIPVQKLVLNYSNKFIVLGNTLGFILLTYVNMASHLITKLLLMLTKNITEDAIFFTNIIFLLLIYYLLHNLFFKVTFKDDESFSEIINEFKVRDVVFELFLIILLIIPNLTIYSYNYDNHNVTSIILNIYSIIISTIIYISFIIKQKKYRATAVKLEQQQLYNKTLCETVDSLRLLKHDYNNILQTLNGYIITKQYDLLDEHIKKLISSTKDEADLECINPNILNQPAIYGIVGAKYYKARKNNIPFRIEVFEDISSISFDSTKLSRILGILLDNAIEAAQKSSNPLIELKFIYDDSKKAHLIKIKNTFKEGIKIDVNKIFEKGESSKKKKSGLGLWEVKKILSTVDNAYIFANITSSNKFEQTLVC